MQFLNWIFPFQVSVQMQLRRYDVWVKGEKTDNRTSFWPPPANKNLPVLLSYLRYFTKVVSTTKLLEDGEYQFVYIFYILSLLSNTQFLRNDNGSKLHFFSWINLTRFSLHFAYHGQLFNLLKVEMILLKMLSRAF